MESENAQDCLLPDDIKFCTGLCLCEGRSCRTNQAATFSSIVTAGFISEPIFRPYMALKDCIPVESDTVEEEEDPQLEEKDGVGESSHYWLQLEKVALTDALDLPLSRAHVEYSQSSDYFSEASSPDSLSRSISSSNVSELGIEDDLTELEDAEMLSSFRSTRGE